MNGKSEPTPATADRSAVVASPQPSLFGDLPRTEAGGKTARRARAMVRRGERAAVTPSRDDVGGRDGTGGGDCAVAHPPAAVTTIVVETVPAPFDPAALSQAELRGVVAGLPDGKLTFLLTEAARELKRRIMPDDGMDSADPDATPSEPDPGLLRAARAVVGELSGEDDFGGGYGGGSAGGAVAARKSVATRGRGGTRGRYSG